MPKPKYYFFAFDNVIAKEKTDAHISPVFSIFSANEHINNITWLREFIEKRHQAGDMIFVLAENRNLRVPIYYLKKMFGDIQYKTYINHIQYYSVDQTPKSIIEAIEACFQAVQLNYQKLKFDVVLIAAKQNCVDAVIKEGGEGILVERNSDKYIKDLNEVLKNSALDPQSKEAQTLTMLKYLERSQQYLAQQPSAASGVSERSPLIFSSGSAIDRSPTTTFATQSGFGISRSASFYSTSEPALNRSSSVSSAPPFSLGVRDSSGVNASFAKSNNDEFEDDDANNKGRRCRWCCC